ncbi:MAG: transposase [Methanobrevibacter sp.]|nr:transposase [Candidatus Methanovirga australis]
MRSLCDRVSFRKFLGWSPIPDKATIWLFRERLSKSGVMEAMVSIQ